MDYVYRRGTHDDAREVFDVFARSTADLERRIGSPEQVERWTNPQSLARIWDGRISLAAHLTRTSDEFWVAESVGEIVGFARSTLHDGVRELIEFFVLPEHQGRGVGRELLERSFSPTGSRLRAVIAAADVPAFARYLKSGVYPRFPVHYLYRAPEPAAFETDLTFTPITHSAQALADLRKIDAQVVGFERDADHEFLIGDRSGYFCSRGDLVVGYAYFGNGTGPIALLEETDFAAVLAFGESLAAADGDDEYGMNVPMHNRAAVDYLLGRGFRIESFVVYFMTDSPFGRFENYIISSPAMFL